MKTKPIAIMLLSVAVLAPVQGHGQVTPPPGGQRQRLELERRLQLNFQRSVQRQLQLETEAVDRLQEVLRSFQEDRLALNRAQASLRHRLRDPALPDLGEEQAREILQEMVELQRRELALYEAEQEQLLELMSPVQLVRFYRLRDDLGQRIQQLRQGRGPGGGVGIHPLR